MAQIDKLLHHLKDNGGSDLHLVAGLEPRIRAKGRIGVIDGWGVLGDEQVRDLLREITTTKSWDEYDTTHDLDFAYGLEGVARFRANYFVQNGGAAAVFRIIPEEIISLEDLKLVSAKYLQPELASTAIVTSQSTFEELGDYPAQQNFIVDSL